ncbi:MAG: hypothetical protein ACK56F_17810, partial [bacterium]
MQRRPTKTQPHEPSHPTAATTRIQRKLGPQKVTKTSIQNNLKLTSQPAESARYPAQRHPKHSIGSAGITHGRPSGE